MAASVKNRIRAGTVFLFLLVVASGAFSLYYLLKLRNQSKNILQANYESLAFCHQMQTALDSIGQHRKAFVDSFEAALQKQEANITESGEREATAALRSHFDALKSGDTTTRQFSNVSYYLQTVLALNMKAIKQKAEKAEKSADEATTLLILIVAFIFIIGFSFAFSFPSVLTAPIQKLTEGIKKIGEKDYSHRVRIESKDELGELANAFNEMAERLQYFESSNLNKLLFEKARAEAVINSLKDASIGIDKEGIVLFANEQALQLLGLRSGNVVGQSAEAVSKRNDLFHFLLNSDSKAPFKIVLDNRENYFVKETVDVAQGESHSKVIILKNITPFKEMDVAKTNFMATVSHEIKTPLASSDFSLRLLEDERTGKLTAEQKELVQNIRQDNERMLKILSELLNLSQVEAGKIELNKERFRPEAIVRNAIETVASAAKEKGIHLVESFEGDLPELFADAEKTTWVLNNFLTNAVKYSPAGSRIETGIQRNEEGVLFFVKDEGPGIAEEYQPKLFDRYFRVPGSTSKGTGLGLAISKDFIEAQGGSIWVESEAGRGATFSFVLPTQAAVL